MSNITVTSAVDTFLQSVNAAAFAAQIVGGTFGAVNGSALTALNASNISSGSLGAGVTIQLGTVTLTGNLPDARNTVSNSTTTTMSALATIGGTSTITGASATSIVLTGGSTGSAVTIGQGTNGGMGVALKGTGIIDIAKPSATSTRETILRAKVSDSGNDVLLIANGTISDGTFVPRFAGYHETSNTRPSVSFSGLVSAANDTSDSSLGGIVDITANRTDSASDPLNGALTPVVNRKILTVTNVGTPLLSIYPGGGVSISGSPANPGAYALAVSGTSTLAGGAIYGTYTVGTFPTTTYLEAVVTDALTPVVGMTVSAGGSAKAKVMYNGSAKIVTAVL